MEQWFKEQNSKSTECSPQFALLNGAKIRRFWRVFFEEFLNAPTLYTARYTVYTVYTCRHYDMSSMFEVTFFSVIVWIEGYLLM